MAQLSHVRGGTAQASRRSRRDVWPDILIACLLFVLVAGLYLRDRTVVQRSDSLWTLHIAMSVLREGNVDLNEYSAVIAPTDYRVMEVDGSVVSYFPPGTPLLITPALLVIDPLLRVARGVEFYQDVLLDPDPYLGLATDVETALACLIVALAAPVLYACGRMQLDRVRAALLALIFAFGTAAWSTASRGLWQHGPSMLMLALALLVTLQARRKARWIQWAGLPLAISFVCRPTNAVPILFFTLFVLLQYRCYFIRYCVWAGIVAVLFVWFSLAVYGAILPPYYLPQRIGGHAHFWEGLAGNLISPARGLLVYSPVFLFSGYGAYQWWRMRQLRGLEMVVVGTIVCHWLVISAFPHWWGGTSYGPRFFADVTPFLIYLLIPVVAQIGKSQVVLTTALGLLVVASVWMHYRGATQWATWQWNEPTPGVVAGIDEDPSRVWDWSDPPFLRGLG